MMIGGGAGGEFVGARLELARAFQQMTLKALASTVSASIAALANYERGFRQPSDDLVAALAQTLSVRSSFFYSPVDDPWLESECSFRRRVATPENVKKRARAHGTLLGLVVRELGRIGVKIPAFNFPTIGATSRPEIEAAAEVCREQWRLGLGPIEHVGRVAERNGAILVRHLKHADKIDAFARRGTSSLIVLNVSRTSASRWIFDVAHEMGHFVLHPGIETGTRDTETQANWFASALLMPRKTFGREFRARPFTWPHVFDLKRRWLASASAIIRRAYDLSLLDPVTYRRCYQHMSIQGWLKGEPYEPTFAGPEWLASAFSLAATRFKVTAVDFCERMGLTSETFTAVTGMPVETGEPIRFPKPRLLVPA
jgi:Zn-dependent peptidase ImmA (M78 family)/transcriptional regulator with XRE-family HTH domain